MSLNDTFTSTGSKLAWHTEAMQDLKNGKNHPLVSHIMLTDRCQDKCSFCSVSTRGGDTLPFNDVLEYVDILRPFGLRALIFSGGGNPILYKDKVSGKGFNDIVDAMHERGLQMGLITNGITLKDYPVSGMTEGEMGMEFVQTTRKSWVTVKPATLDKLTWIRISMSGIDHERNIVEVPDINPAKTTLGFSYVFADIFEEPNHEQHGQVSTPGDLTTLDRTNFHDRLAMPRIPELTEQIGDYVRKHRPVYCRLLPDCLRPELLAERSDVLRTMANEINATLDYSPVFVQEKPPQAPRVCYMASVHPVLAPSGMVFPCDSVVIAAADVGYKLGIPNHKFDNKWAICHWKEIGKFMSEPIRSPVNPPVMCKGCLFSKQANLLDGIVNGTINPTPPAEEPQHAFFV